MEYIIKENTWLKRELTDFGWGNGYVLIPEGNIFHGLDYNDIMQKVQVNEELTFSSMVNEEMVNHWPELRKQDIGKWCVGWDSCHVHQNISNYPKEVIDKETQKLMNILLSCNP